ncbi:MAG: M16 family metallopeptidase [Chitinophagales bacterium]
MQHPVLWKRLNDKLNKNMERIAPELNKIDRLEINNFKTTKLFNGTDLYYVDGVEEDLIRVELKFHAGRWYEPQKVVSRAVCNLMKKGTSSKTNKQIADIIEFYGAHFEIHHAHDDTAVSIFCLGKYLKEILPVAEEILTDASFTDDELEHFVKKQKQKLQINAQNTDFHANRKFNNVLFGEEHPYGYVLFEKDLDAINGEILKSYHRIHYNPADATIFVSGKIQHDTIELINTHFGNYTKNGKVISATDKSIDTAPENNFFIRKEDSVQSSVRIGGLTISKKHPDYPDLNILNTAFGGYFGSRLMTNIREDKGYTYGIHSAITHFNHASYFSIETEVGNEVCEKAIEEIYKEMDLMKKKPLDIDEMTIVQNYMMTFVMDFRRTYKLEHIYFDPGKWDIKSESQPSLDSLADVPLEDEEEGEDIVCVPSGSS